MVEFALVPERTAIVNVDMQNCFVHGSPFSAPEGLAVQERINRGAAACHAAGIVVIHACHVLRLDGSNTCVLGRDLVTCEERHHQQGFRIGRVTQRVSRRCRGYSARKTAFRCVSWYGPRADSPVARHRQHHRHRHRHQCLLRNNSARGCSPRLS